MQHQLGALGIDWNSLINIGANVASNINAAVSGSPNVPTYGVVGATGVSPFTNLTSSPLFLPLVIGGVLLFVLAKNK